MILDWKWNPRYDNDLVQRCLTIISWTILTKWIVSSFISCWHIEFTIDLLALIALGLGFCKSALQYDCKGKSVLITGSKSMSFLRKLHEHSLTPRL